MDKWNLLTIIALAVGIFALLSTGGSFLYAGIISKSTSNKSNKINNQIEQLQKIDTSCPGPIELPCREGPLGPQGPSGGIFTDKGPLRNLGQIDMVVDRSDDSGSAITAFLSQQNYKPQQTWTLNSSKDGLGGVLENQYGGCLTVDEANSVQVKLDCKNATKWLFTAQGNLKPITDKTKCLSFTNAGMAKNVEKSGLINLKNKNVNLYSNLLKLNLAKCDNQAKVEQQWAFN